MYSEIHFNVEETGFIPSLTSDEILQSFVQKYSLCITTGYYKFSGLSLALKKVQITYRKKSVGYTPLVEVNQAIISLVV